MAIVRQTPWDATIAVGACPQQPWSGTVWRFHGNNYSGDDAARSLTVTGRFNRGADKFPHHETWQVLYTSLGPHVALGERIRHTSAKNLSKLANQRMSRLHIDLQVVVLACLQSSCAQLNIPGLNESDLCHQTNYEKTQEFAKVARTFAEGILIPSCTKFPEGNLIIFPDRILRGSSISVEESQDPNLFVDWDSMS